MMALVYLLYKENPLVCYHNILYVCDVDRGNEGSHTLSGWTAVRSLAVQGKPVSIYIYIYIYIYYIIIIDVCDVDRGTKGHTRCHVGRRWIHSLYNENLFVYQ